MSLSYWASTQYFFYFFLVLLQVPAWIPAWLLKMMDCTWKYKPNCFWSWCLSRQQKENYNRERRVITILVKERLTGPAQDRGSWSKPKYQDNLFLLNSAGRVGFSISDTNLQKKKHPSLQVSHTYQQLLDSRFLTARSPAKMSWTFNILYLLLQNQFIHRMDRDCSKD